MEITAYDVIQPIPEIHAYVGDCLVVDHHHPGGGEALYHAFRRYGEIASYVVPPSLMYLLKKHADKLRVKPWPEENAADHAKVRPSLAVHTNPRPVGRARTARPQLALVQ